MNLKRLESYLALSPVGYTDILIGLYDLKDSLPNLFLDQVYTSETIAGTAVGLFCLGIGIDIASSHIDSYRKLRDSMEETGYDPDRGRKFMYTWCGRNVIRAAAKETGHLEEFHRQCEAEGHKWYHFLPKLDRWDERECYPPKPTPPLMISKVVCALP